MNALKNAGAHFVFDWLRSSFPGVIRPRRGGGHSLSSSVAGKNEWSYAFNPPICLHGLDMARFAFYNIIRNIIGNEYSDHLQKQYDNALHCWYRSVTVYTS